MNSNNSTQDIQNKVNEAQIRLIQNQLKGQNFRNLMKKCNTNKYRIARDTGISYRTLCSWQAGKTTPSVDSVILVGKYLGIFDNFADKK